MILKFSHLLQKHITLTFLQKWFALAWAFIHKKGGDKNSICNNGKFAKRKSVGAVEVTFDIAGNVIPLKWSNQEALRRRHFVCAWPNYKMVCSCMCITQLMMQGKLNLQQCQMRKENYLTAEIKFDNTGNVITLKRSKQEALANL